MRKTEADRVPAKPAEEGEVTLAGQDKTAIAAGANGGGCFDHLSPLDRLVHIWIPRCHPSDLDAGDRFSGLTVHHPAGMYWDGEEDLQPTRVSATSTQASHLLMTVTNLFVTRSLLKSSMKASLLFVFLEPGSEP